MKITILSRSATVPSTKRLLAEARARGHAVTVLNPAKVELHFQGHTPGLLYQRKPLAVPDVVIPRVASSVASYALSVVDQFSMRNVVVLNDARAIAQARNPMRCLQQLSLGGVEVPATVMAREAVGLTDMVSFVGGLPVLVKIQKSDERHATMVCETLQSLEAALEAVLGLGHNLVVQQYVKTGGRDLRVVVIGGVALAAVRREGRRRKKVSMTALELTPELAKTAERAAKVLGLEVATIDLLESKALGLRVFDVASVPALPELEAVTHVNLARAIIERAETLVNRAHLKAVTPLSS